MQVPMLTTLLVKTHLFESFWQDVIEWCSRKCLSQIKSHNAATHPLSQAYTAESGALSQSFSA